MNKNLGQIFVDGRFLNLDDASMENLENALNKVREERVEKINKIAKIVNDLQK